MTGLAMLGFAANSLLCRAALGPGRVDAASFTALRLGSGALALLSITRLSRAPAARATSVGNWGSWASAAALSTYAIGFSLAYLRIDAGAGALILFGSVQISMIGGGILRGERPSRRQWVGCGVSFAGLGALLVPGITAPDGLGSGLMALAGVAWGVYSLRGRDTGSPPLLATTGNFVRSVPLGLGALAVGLPQAFVTPAGIALAITSGAVASAGVYALWYSTLPALGATRAAVVQLSVPVLAALGGVALLGERAGLRLLTCGAVILGGVALAVTGNAARRTPLDSSRRES